MDDKPPREPHNSSHGSLFWPFVLVGVGMVWLLNNLGILSTDRLWSLVRFWPVLLIAIGLDLVFGRRRPWVGALIGALTLGAVVWLLFAAREMAMPPGITSQLTTTRLREPIGRATSALVELNLAEAPVTLKALDDSDDLIDATLVHRRQIDLRVSGDEEKTVVLGPSGAASFPLIGLLAGEGARWDIGLTPDIPLQLDIRGGSGSAQLDLGRLQLARFDLDVNSGGVRAALPATEGRCRVVVEGGSGRLRLALPERSQVDLDLNVHSGATDLTIGQGSSVKALIDGGSGRLLVEAPEGAALRVTVSGGGSGSVTLREDLRQVSDGNDRDEDTGVWETADFGSAPTTIEMTIDLGSGSVIVR